MQTPPAPRVAIQPRSLGVQGPPRGFRPCFQASRIQLFLPGTGLVGWGTQLCPPNGLVCPRRPDSRSSSATASGANTAAPWPPDLLLIVDHILPVAKGGKNGILNLVTACQPCNAGQSDRALDDHSMLAKQRDQLAELSECREQLEIMIRWKEGVCDLRDTAVERLAEHWSRPSRGYSLNELGCQQLRKLAGKYQVAEIMDAMVAATDQYLVLANGQPTKASVENASNKVGAICHIKHVAEEKPYINDLLYVRAMLRNRIGLKPFGVMEMLEEAHLGGMSIIELKRAARACGNWWSFENSVGCFLQGEWATVRACSALAAGQLQVPLAEDERPWDRAP